MGGQVASLSEPKPVEVLIGSAIDHRQLGHAQKLPGNKPGNPAYLRIPYGGSRGIRCTGKSLCRDATGETIKEQESKSHFQ